MARARYHGLETTDGVDEGWVRFGFLRLLQALSTSFRFPFPAPGGAAERLRWQEAWFDRKFDQAVRRFQDIFFKLDRVAAHFSECLDEIRRFGTTLDDVRRPDQSASLDIAAFARFQNAYGDVEIYLDSLLFYLRIHADCIANIVPNLYGQQARRASLARDSFRDHIRWFGRMSAFDPVYAAFLSTNTGWFEKLAGGSRGQGLRDKIVHHRATYQLSWTTGSRFELHAGLVGDSGFLIHDVVSEVKEIVGGYCLYLDGLLEHFSRHLQSEIQGSVVPSLPDGARYYRFTGGPLASAWIYPLVTPA